jgi:hypothetical protein
MDRAARKLERMLEQKALGDLACAYMFFHKHYGDHKSAMVATCKWAIRSGFEPAACWVSTGMLAAKKPTHTVAFQKGTSPLFMIVITGGVSIWGNLNVMYAPEEDVHAGWRTLSERDVIKYREWAEQPE